MSNGEDVIAELPLEHLVMYDTWGNGRLGRIMKLTPVCVCCHKTGVHFLIIQEGKRKRFSLYTEDYVEITIDHIKPKHLGGENKNSNYQILCLFCNRAKGSTEMSIEDLRKKIKCITARM